MLAVLGSVQYLTAGEKPKSQDGASFTIVTGPLEFVSVTPLAKRGDGQRGKKIAGLRVKDTVTLAGKKALSLKKGAEIRVGQKIKSGAILSVGALSILRDSNGKERVLHVGEGFVVASTRFVSCKQCAAFSTSTCGQGNVQSVNCGANKSCVWTCFTSD